MKERRRLLRGSSSDAGTPRWPRRPSAGRRNLAHFYGLTLDEFDALVLAHEGRCALCGQAHPKLNVDHCHETGKVRGLLCIGCNTSLGRFGDNEAGLLRALAYIRS